MSSAKTLVDLGGPVFPQETHNADGSTSVWFGMNLRDLFAAAAMQGMMSDPEAGRIALKSLAEEAYLRADAMLAAREKQ